MPQLELRTQSLDLRAWVQTHSEGLPELKTKAQVEEWRENAVFEHLTPWFHQYRAVLGKYLGASEHETFSHPIGHLLCISTSDPDPMATVKALAAKPLPPVFSKGPAVVSQLKHLYPTHVLTINTANPQDAAPVPDVWAPVNSEYDPVAAALQGSPTTPMRKMSGEVFHLRARGNSISTGRGTRLSPNDFASVDALMSQFLAPQIYGHIASRIKEWERDVASTRRGISNRLFKVGLKYFGGSSKQNSSQPSSYVDPTTQVTMFPFGSPEMIMRRLGDFAFMIRDYKYALSVYELVKKDFATEKYYRFYAGVQVCRAGLPKEMITVANILLAEGGRANYEASYDAAVQSYMDGKAPLFAYRTTIWVAEAIKEQQAYREAAFVYIRMTKDKSRSKVNYETALAIYGDLGWTLITDHINFALGKEAIQRNQYDVAVDYFIKLLRKSKQSAAVHRAYLAEFLYLYQQFTATADAVVVLEKMATLPIPALDDSTITLSATDPSRSHSSSHADAELAGASWEDLEQEAFRLLPKSNLSSLKKEEASLECAVGEPVFVSFEWLNPMQVPIPVNNVYLECAFGDEAPPSSGAHLNHASPRSRIEHPHFDIEVLADTALDSNEKKVVTLKVYPKTEGQIRVVGLCYLLCGIIPTYRSFSKKSKGADSKQLALTLNVKPPMPVLDVVFHNFREDLLAGQVSHCTLELHNKGGRGFESLYVKASHGSICFFGDGTLSNELHYLTLKPDEGRAMVQQVSVSNKLADLDIIPLALPATDGGSGSLEPGTTTLVP
ncbi:Trafficking protein particle complex 8, partial [Kappamyces sp. JEL0680]